MKAFSILPILSAHHDESTKPKYFKICQTKKPEISPTLSFHVKVWPIDIVVRLTEENLSSGRKSVQKNLNLGHSATWERQKKQKMNRFCTTGCDDNSVLTVTVRRQRAQSFNLRTFSFVCVYLLPHIKPFLRVCTFSWVGHALQALLSLPLKGLPWKTADMTSCNVPNIVHRYS